MHILLLLRNLFCILSAKFGRVLRFNIQTQIKLYKAIDVFNVYLSIMFRNINTIFFDILSKLTRLGANTLIS